MEIRLDSGRRIPTAEEGQRIRSSVRFVKRNEAYLGLSPTRRPTPPLRIPPMAAPIPVRLPVPANLEPQIVPEDHITPAASPSAIPLPIYTRPPSFNPIHQAVDGAILAALRDAITRSIEEEPRIVPDPVPTPPSVNEHPGRDWQINFSQGRVQHPILITTPDNQRVLASYYRYDFDLPSPELLLTRGRGQDVHGRPLYARPAPYPKKALTKKQKFLFADDHSWTPYVDRITQDLEDQGIKPDIQRYRWLQKEIWGKAREVVEKRNQFNLLRQDLEEVGRRLGAADAYMRIAPPIIYDVPREVPPEERPQAQRASDALTNGWYDEETRNEQCQWCFKGHPTDKCIHLCQCTYCDGFTHMEHQCKRPHDHCVTEEVCKVVRDHLYFNHGPCPSNVPTWDF